MHIYLEAKLAVYQSLTARQAFLAICRPRLAGWLGLLTGLLLLAGSSAAQRPDNTRPLYGEVPKTNRYQRIDKRFIRESVAYFGTRDSAARQMTRDGWEHLKRHDLATAVKRFNQAWLLDSLLPDPFFGFSVVLALQKQPAEAARFHQMGVQLDPTHRLAPRYYIKLAECKAFYHDHDGTLAAYHQYTQWLPDRADGYQQLAYHLMEINRDSAALVAFRRALELAPHSASTYNNRGWLHFKNKRYLLALPDLSKAIELQPTYISAYVNRGLTRLAAGSAAGARADFAEGARLDPKSLELRVFLAEACEALGDLAAACTEYRAAQGMKPPPATATELAIRVARVCRP